ncbi:hypothetical protein HAX54_024742, partial [Datura stramonium]|nr:hypothetical protein [Datura stramonium]
MKTALLHWEDAILISERLVTNDSRFPCLSAIVYTYPSKWSTLPSSWVTRSLSLSLTTAAADSTPLVHGTTRRELAKIESSLPSTTYLLPLLLLELLDIDLRDTRPGARGRDAAIDGPVLPLDLRIMED